MSDKQTRLIVPQGDKAIAALQMTSDYSRFKRLPGNRRVKLQLVQDLILSYTEKPQLKIARPLLLNEKNQVIDGQHRKEALERIQEPIPYLVVPGLTIRDARLLNALQQSWSLQEFAESLAETEDGKFQDFVDLMKEYRMPPRIMLMYTTGSPSMSISARFKTGDYTPQPKEIIQSRLDKLTSFEPYMRFWNEQAFAQAIFKLLTTDEFDYDRLMRKLKENTKELTHRGSSVDYIRDLEHIYNLNLGGARFIRLM